VIIVPGVSRRILQLRKHQTFQPWLRVPTPWGEKKSPPKITLKDDDTRQNITLFIMKKKITEFSRENSDSDKNGEK
jgi:hypothetical protein